MVISILSFIIVVGFGFSFTDKTVHAPSKLNQGDMVAGLDKCQSEKRWGLISE